MLCNSDDRKDNSNHRHRNNVHALSPFTTRIITSQSHLPPICPSHHTPPLLSHPCLISRLRPISAIPAPPRLWAVTAVTWSAPPHHTSSLHRRGPIASGHGPPRGTVRRHLNQYPVIGGAQSVINTTISSHNTATSASRHISRHNAAHYVALQRPR